MRLLPSFFVCFRVVAAREIRQCGKDDLTLWSVLFIQPRWCREKYPDPCQLATVPSFLHLPLMFFSLCVPLVFVFEVVNLFDVIRIWFLMVRRHPRGWFVPTTDDGHLSLSCRQANLTCFSLSGNSRTWATWGKKWEIFACLQTPCIFRYDYVG